MPISRRNITVARYNYPRSYEWLHVINLIKPLGKLRPTSNQVRKLSLVKLGNPQLIQFLSFISRHKNALFSYIPTFPVDLAR